MVRSLCDVRDGAFVDGSFVDSHSYSVQARILDSTPQFARRNET